MALNLNQFGSILGGAAKGAANGFKAAGPLGIGAGAAIGAAKSKGAQPAIKNATNIAGGAAKGAAKGALGGPAGIAAGGMLGAATSKSGQKVLGGAAKGALTGLKTAGPLGIGIGGAIGAIGGLFGGNKATAKPKTAAPAKPTPYTVQKGDTLTSIAKKQGTTVDAIRQANPKFTNNPKYKNGNMIWAGTTVNPTGPNNQKQKTTPKKAAPVPNKAGGGIASKTLPAIGQAAGGAAGAPVVNGLKSVAGRMGIL